jgi:hypothetical protein
MADKKRERELKRKRRLQDRHEKEVAKRSLFMDGLDLYSDEYDSVLRNPGVRGLLGPFELDDTLFYSEDDANVLRHCGISGYSKILYSSEHESGEHRDTRNAKGTGYASAFFDANGMVRAAVFVRRRTEEENDHSEVEYATLLLVLVHEIGHAVDILRQIRDEVDLASVKVFAKDVWNVKGGWQKSVVHERLIKKHAQDKNPQ